jgi:hypothetical protein
MTTTYRTASVDGLKVFYREAGDPEAPPVLKSTCSKPAISHSKARGPRSRRSFATFSPASYRNKPAPPNPPLILQKRNPIVSKTVLITGASTGFGRDTAETLARAGYTVFASMRNLEAQNRDHAQALRKQGIEVVELDVSSDASVDQAVKAVLAHVRRIDVLVNNAGVASAGVTEAFTPDQAKVVFNTNVVELLRTIRSVLPPCADKVTG